eukprot:scaffold2829_cov33-Phaeocystis_antarctica.AAC.1
MEQHPSEQSTPSSSDNLLPKLWMPCRPRPGAARPTILAAPNHHELGAPGMQGQAAAVRRRSRTRHLHGDGWRLLLYGRRHFFENNGGRGVELPDHLATQLQTTPCAPPSSK